MQRTSEPADELCPHFLAAIHEGCSVRVNVREFGRGARCAKRQFMCVGGGGVGEPE